MMANTRKRDSHNKKCCNTSFLIKLPQLVWNCVRLKFLFISFFFNIMPYQKV